MPSRRISPIRLRLVIAIVLIMFGAGFFLWSRARDLTTLGFTITLGPLALGVGILLLSYLRGEISIGPIDNLITPAERSSSADVEFLSSMLSRVTSALTKLQQEFADIKNDRSIVAHTDVDSIRAVLRDDVIADVANRLDERYARSAAEATHVSQVRRNFDEAFLRLRSELAALTRRGNLNLVIGTLTTAVAVGLLFYMLIPEQTISSWPVLLSHYVPRLTTVVFIEVFAFFFLRLYKSSLAQIQYYQNELTTLTLNWSAFELGNTLPQGLSVVVDRFAGADRNGRAPQESTVAPSSDLVPVAELLKKIVEVVVTPAKK